MFATSQKGRRGRLPAALGIVFVLLALLIGVAGCGGSSESNATGAGESEEVKLSSAEVPEATLGFTGKDVTLNLFTAPTAQNVSLMANVVEGMLAYGPDGSLHDNLAESWKEVSPTEYLYTLRKGARFSTGAPVTVDDVLYSLKHAMDPTTGAVTSSYYLKVKAVEKVGSDSIKVTLKQPDPTWRYIPGHYPAWVYEKKSMIAAGEDLGSPQGIPIGSGPYAISEFTNDHITFVRNEYYDGPKPPVAKFTMRLIADPGTSLAAMQSGDIDGAVYLPLQSTAQWEAIPGVKLYSTVSGNVDILWYNTSKAPFDDPHVRRMMLYAFDREGITKSIFHGKATVSPTQVPPALWVNEMSEAEAEERSGEMGREYPFDLEKAKQELAKSKYPDGFSTTAIYTSSAPELGLALQALSESRKEVDVDLKV